MPLDDSVFGGGSSLDQIKSDLVSRYQSADAGEPFSSDPVVLSQRLARKLRLSNSDDADIDFTPKKAKPAKAEKEDLSSFGDALPDQPSTDDLSSFGSKVEPAQSPQPTLGVGGNLKAFGKGVPVGAIEGTGNVLKGAAALYENGVPATPETQQYDAMGNPTGFTTPPQEAIPAKPLKERTLYKAGEAVSSVAPEMSPQERESWGGTIGTMIGGVAPYAALTAADPALGIAAGFTGMSASTYGHVYEDALAKGADEATARSAAAKAAGAAGVLGSLPLGSGKLAQSLIGKIATSGISFASANEASEYVLQQIAKDYDPKAGYSPEAKRIIASLITGGLLGGLHHAFERAPEPQPDQQQAPGPGEPPTGALPHPDDGGPDPGSGGWRPYTAEQEMYGGTGHWKDNGDGSWTDTNSGRTYREGPDGRPREEAGPQGGPRPGSGGSAGGNQSGTGGGPKPNQGGPGTANKPPPGSGEGMGADYTMDAGLRAKMERIYRTFEPGKDPSKMADHELYNAVNEHLRDTSSTGHTAKGDTPEEQAQREAHAKRRDEDQILRDAGWSEPHIQAMTPEQRTDYVARAQGKTSTAPVEEPVNATPGTREAPIKATTAADVDAAVPAEPKSPAQAEAENYKHAHVELEHLGLTGSHSISIETGKGQVRKGVDADGKPWEVTMPVAYGRIKGTKGADGQPLDIFIGPEPTSPHIFVVDQHHPEGGFDEHKIMAGFPGPDAAIRAYADSYTDQGGNRIGHVTALTPDQFKDWLKGDTTKPLKKSLSSKEIDNLFDELISSAGAGAEDGSQPAKPSSEKGGEPEDRASDVGSPQLPHAPSDGGRSPVHAGAESEAGVEPRDGFSKGYAEPTEEHHAQIEAVLGTDHEHVLPVDVVRAAEILAENPGVTPEQAFQYAVIQNAYAHHLLTREQLEQVYGQQVNGILGTESTQSPAGGAHDQAREAGEKSPSGSAQAREPASRGAAGASQNPASENREQPNAEREKPDTERQARGGEAAQRAQGAEGSRRSTSEVEPQNLLQFIASKGGLKPHAELAALDADKHLVAMQGFPPRRKLVKDAGLDLDMAREAAEEAGYLKGEHDRTSTIRDLLDAIDEGLRGNHRFPEGHEGTKDKRERRLDAEREQHEQDRHEADYAAAHKALDAEYPGIPLDLRDTAARAMVLDGYDVDTAVEYAAIWQVNSDPDYGETEHSIVATFGPGAKDAIQDATASGNGEPPAQAGEGRARPGEGEEAAGDGGRVPQARAASGDQERTEGVAHGRNARRRGKDDQLSKYLKVNRPKKSDEQGWISYRTEATLAYNTAREEGAPRAVLDALRAEAATANRYLRKNRPEVMERLERAQEASPLDGLGPVERHNAIYAEADRRYPPTEGKPDKKGNIERYVSHEHIAFTNGASGNAWDTAMPINATWEDMRGAFFAGDRWAQGLTHETDDRPSWSMPGPIPNPYKLDPNGEKIPLTQAEIDAATGGPTTETGADNKQQTVIPGAEKASDATMAQRGANARLKPKAPQKAADTGLFGDEKNQTDLLDAINKPAAPKDVFDDVFDQALDEQFGAKPDLSLDDVTKGLQGLFGKKPSGLAEPETSFDNDLYAQALPFLKAGISHFAGDGADLPTMVRGLVKHLATSGMDADAIRSMKPYIRRFTEDVLSGKEPLNAPSRSEILESDRGEPAAGDRVGTADVPPAAGADGQGAGPRGAAADAGEQRRGGGERLPEDYAPVVGASGNLEVPAREPVVEDGDAADRDDRGGGADRQEGFSFDDTTADEAVRNAQKDADLNRRRQAQRAADNKRIPVKPGNLQNIADTLPMLFPEQHEDVKGAELRFHKTEGHGMLFTNGTGTGKTYSGLGVIKRFALQGKHQAMVIAPSQGILEDWARSARDLGLEMHILDSAVDGGRPGLNGTTYANFGTNDRLADREWDLVVPDEAHKLSSDQDGTVTDALATLRALTYHPDGLHRRAEMVLRSLHQQIKPLPKNPTAQESARHSAAVKAFNDRAAPLIAEWKDRARNKALFLSATPFAYHFSLDWAQGYLFEFDRSEDNKGGYNSGDGRAKFYMQHLGYRMRTNKLTKPDAEVDSGVMERQLHEYLRKQGSLSGRVLTVDKDYDRKFVLAHEAIGDQIDQALNFLQENEQFRPLVDYVAKRFDYLTRMRLLEAIKARAAIPFIQKNLDLGRKVVVFHDYNEGGGINPFELDFSPEAKTTVYSNGKMTEVGLRDLYQEFVRQNPYVKELKFSAYPAPIAALTTAFPDALVYNGTIAKGKRSRAKALFNDDNSGRDLIIIQSQAGEAGISLHDTTGRKQRALLNLGMPIRPVSSIQQEGRIYRVGQASDAIFRYMNTGTDWERWTFAGKIADRAGTAENLALGNQARTIRQSFIDAFSNSDDFEPQPGEGTGGKELDRAVNSEMSEFQKAKTHYYAQRKVTGRRDQREGADYYGTPEPLGYKMVEWAGVKPGEKMLEPSGGHGAIARYFPENTARTIVEPSSSLASRASLQSPGARMVIDRFENLDTGANKFDTIVMNPRFGSGGKTAIDHLAKAAQHIKNGGRIVALIPRGATADKRFDDFMDSPIAKGIYQVANIDLPSVTFERAGTSVSTRIVVLEKQTDREVAKQLEQKNRDYSSAQTIGELFDRIEHAELPPRLEPKTKDVDAPTSGRVTVGGVEFDLQDDSKRSEKPTFWAVPKTKLRDRFQRVAKAAETAGGRWWQQAFEFKSLDARQAFLNAVENPPPEEKPKAPSGVTFKTGETTHAKTGDKLFVASPNERVERSVYEQLAAMAKAQGGWWSSYNSKGAIPGFQFKSADARQRFLDAMGGGGGGGGGLKEPERLADEFKPTHGQPLGEAAQDFIVQHGLATGNEWLVAIDANGNAIEVKEGDPRSIVFSAELDVELRIPENSIVLHHNHPSNRSFSGTDIAQLAMPGLAALWAHGRRGSVYRVALSKKAAERMPLHVSDGQDVLFKAYNRVKNILRSPLIRAVEDGRLSEDAGDQLWGHLINEALRLAGIVDYTHNREALPAGAWGLNNVLQQAVIAAQRVFFNHGAATGSPDRYANPVRLPGDMGELFGRIGEDGRILGQSDAGRRSPGDDQGEAPGEDPGVGGTQPRLLEGSGLASPPSLFDKSFNDLLGKRLLGRLGDLNATEARVQLQDKFLRVQKAEQLKRNLDPQMSAYQAESLYYGRTGYRLEQLREHQIDPLIREMKARDIDLNKLDDFLYARHAVERNQRLGQHYEPGHDFYEAMTDPDKVGASGMSQNEALGIIRAIRDAGKLPDYQAVARMVDALNARTRRALLDGGLIDRDAFDAMNAAYKYYVPLRGWQEGSDEEEFHFGPGGGMETRGKDVKQAFGRKSRAASPLAYSIMQAESAVVRAEKNKVGNTFLKFVRANPDPDLWVVNRPQMRKQISKLTGLVQNRPDNLSHLDDNVFATKVQGQPVYIRMLGADGINLARALKNMGSANAHAAVRMLGTVTNTMSRLATAWNPEFMIPNLVRDVSEAFINLGEQRQRQFAKNFAKRVFPAIRGSTLALAGKTPPAGSPMAEYVDAFHRFDREGGRIHFFGLDDPDQIERNVDAKLRRLSGGAINNLKDLGEKAGKALEVAGGGLENATRLAAFMAAEEAGMSAPDAAMLARNLTVNFNKKGELGTIISSLYAFGNAGIQGIARMLRALHPRNTKVWAAVGALAAANLAATAWDLGAGGKDEAGAFNYMKVPHWERDKNIVVMLTNGYYAKIPLPYGFAPFGVVGSKAATVMSGAEKPTKAAAAVLSSTINAFNPLGDEEVMAMETVPSVLRPIFHVQFNKDWTGRAIYPDSDRSKGLPDSTQAFRSTSGASKWVAEKLNDLTGGSKYESGAVDVHPGTFDYLVGAVVGGVGHFLKAGWNTIVSGVMDHEWRPETTPILRRFVGRVGPEADQYAYYQARDEARGEANAVTAARKDRRAGDQDAIRFTNEHRGGNKKAIFDEADQKMRALRAEEDRIKASAQPYEARRAAIEQVRQRMREVQNRARAASAKLQQAAGQ